MRKYKYDINDTDNLPETGHEYLVAAEFSHSYNVKELVSMVAEYKPFDSSVNKKGGYWITDHYDFVELGHEFKVLYYCEIFEFIVYAGVTP